jgi:antitoxin ParD1/3/4
MSRAASISVSLPPELRRFVASRVRSGRCTSPDEVVLEALRVWQRLGERGLDDLRARIERGVDDAENGRFVDPDVVFRRIDRKLARARRTPR